MKHLFTLTVLVSILLGCKVNRYYFVMEEQVPLYLHQDFSDKPKYEVLIGDTITFTGNYNKQVGGSSILEFNNYRFYAQSARSRLIKTIKVSRNKYLIRPGVLYTPAYSSRNRIVKPATELTGNKPSPISYTPSTGATIQTGPKGGRYYINSNGNKTYVPRSGGGSRRP